MVASKHVRCQNTIARPPALRLADSARRLLTVRGLSVARSLVGNYVTSLDMAGLVLSVEAEFDLMIPERDITPANFRSVAAITALVTSLLKSDTKTVSA